MKNAKLAVGAQIEIKAGTDYRKVTYEGVPVVVRLGARTQIGHGAHHLAQRADPERDQASR